MTLTSALRKLCLTAHVAVSVGWVGACSFLAHAIASVVGQDEHY